MGKPLTIFGDPIAGTIAELDAGLTALGASVAGYGSTPPDTPASGKPARPFILVAVDGWSGMYPVLAVATVRVTVWHTSEPKALDLAQRARAVLLSSSGNEWVRSWGEGAGPLPSTDPDTDSPVATFTVNARLIPTPLST